MSEEQKEIDVYESNRFGKAMDKLSEDSRKVVEDEIDRIVEDPGIGEQKKGDLSHLRVHKFSLNNQQCLLGYSWVENMFELYLLSVGAHENFYDEMKRSRKIDLRLVGT